MIDIHTHHPTSAVTISTIGLHPWQAATGTIPTEAEVEATEAVGEIGLDKACTVDFEQQKRVFEAQLRLAEKFRKPVVLHTVRAFEETMTILEKVKLKAVIFHGYIGSKEQAAKAVKKGYYLSFGARTDGSKKTIEALRSTPLENLFVETDEAPVSIEEIYGMIAKLRKVSIDELRQATRENHKLIFETQHE